MSKIVFIAEAQAMIGKRVKAIGACGIKDGVEVEGLLDKLQNGDAIVMADWMGKKNSLPCLVNKNTLELVGNNSPCDF